MYLFHTHRNSAALFSRIALAAVFIPHGLDKLLKYDPLGYMGPEAWNATLMQLVQYSWIPADYKQLLAQVSAWSLVVCGGLCVVGLLVRVAMFPLILHLSGAILLVHGKNGYWSDHTLNGALAPGFEYPMVLILVCMGVLFSGAGSMSVDKLISSEPDFDEYEEDYVYQDEPIDSRYVRR